MYESMVESVLADVRSRDLGMEGTGGGGESAREIFEMGTITTQRGRPQTNSICPNRGAEQESEIQKRGDKTTFICPATGAACQISASRRVRYSGV
jgi:hypothetical protein